MYATFIYSISQPLSSFAALSLAVGVSLVDSLQLKEKGIGLKWPNDLIHIPTKKKLGGILIELVSSQEVSTALIGIGMNVVFHPQDNDTISLQELTNKEVSPNDIAESISGTLYSDLNSFLKNGFFSLKDRWESLSLHKGSIIEIDTESRLIKGSYQGVDAQGALLLLTDSGPVAIQSGHVRKW